MNIIEKLEKILEANLSIDLVSEVLDEIQTIDNNIDIALDKAKVQVDP